MFILIYPHIYRYILIFLNQYIQYLVYTLHYCGSLVEGLRCAALLGVGYNKKLRKKTGPARIELTTGAYENAALSI